MYKTKLYLAVFCKYIMETTTLGILWGLFLGLEMVRYCCIWNSRKNLFRTFPDSFTIENVSRYVSWINLETTYMQISLIKSHVSIIQETTFFTDTFYTYNSNLYYSLIWRNFCVLPKHMYKSSWKFIVLWGRNIRDLVHTWRFNYTYEFSWKWINILCSSNSCFFCFAKQMISEVWTAYGAIWILNVSKKVADPSNLSLFSPTGVWFCYSGSLYMGACYQRSAGKCMRSYQHHVKCGNHCTHFNFPSSFPQIWYVFVEVVCVGEKECILWC